MLSTTLANSSLPQTHSVMDVTGSCRHHCNMYDMDTYVAFQTEGFPWIVDSPQTVLNWPKSHTLIIMLYLLLSEKILYQ